MIVGAGIIPTKEQEKAVTVFHGVQLMSPAYHARHDDLWPPRAGEALPKEEWRRAIDLYLGNFCRPEKTIANHVKCVACDLELSGSQLTYRKSALKLNTETESAEASCSRCGYPVRCKHKITMPAPNEHVILVVLDFFPMCYHPTATENRKAKN